MSDISVQNSGTDDFYDPVSLSAGNWDLIKQKNPPPQKKTKVKKNIDKKINVKLKF